MLIGSYSLYDIVGLMGVAFYVSSYALLQAGWIRGSGATYTWMNLAASSLVLVSLFNDFNLSSAIIQVTWITISLGGLLRNAYLKRAIRFSAEEQNFANAALAHLSKQGARAFFDNGVWIDFASAVTLASEGEQAGGLTYLASGAASVRLAEKPIAELQAGAFIGELSCFTGASATATVVTTKPGRLFRISTENLLRVTQKYPELRASLEDSIRQDIKVKLTNSNAQLTEQGLAPLSAS